MNLQQLRYLVSTAETGSVSGAARAHQVTQPVVSRALHDLERQYHLVLLRRHGRRLVPTEGGQAVVTAARRALEALDAVDQTARRLASGAELVVVATPTNSVLLSPIVASFVQRAPATPLRLRRAGSMGEVFAMLESGEAELGFGDLDIRNRHQRLATDPLWTAEAVVVSPPGSLLPPAPTLADLAGSQMVLPPAGTERRQMIDDLLSRDRDGSRRPALATDERSAWASSAQRGLGSFFSYAAAAAELDGVEVRSLEPPIRVPVGFAYRPGALSGPGRQMMNVARECPAPIGCSAWPPLDAAASRTG